MAEVSSSVRGEVRARAKQGGPSLSANLALCCSLCNKYKGSDLASIDPDIGTITRHFDPRRDLWEDDFMIIGGKLVGRAGLHKPDP